MKKLNFIRTGILMLLLWCSNLIGDAQSTLTFTQAMDSLFAPLDKGRITTGILYERAKPFSNIDLFNISSDPFISEYKYFCQAYQELYNSTYNKNGWLKPLHLRALADGQALQNKYTIGVLDYQFNMIDSNAVANGLLSFSNGQFHDVVGANPYWTRRIQVGAILADQVPSGLVSLVYNPSFVKTNQSIAISNIQLNFGALGSYTLNPTNPVAQINFSGSGVKEFTMTIQYTNGNSFTHASEIQIGDNLGSYSARPLGTSTALPDQTFWISSKYPYQGFGESQAYYAKVKISIWWKRNAQNQPVPGIKKPVIIVDGFDPNGSRMDTSIYTLFNYINQNSSLDNFADELRSFGKDFDIIVMDMPGYTKNYPISGTLNDPTNSLSYPKPLFDNTAPDNPDGTIYGGGDFQQRNAYALEYLIDYCNQQMQINGSNEKLVLVGPSMGGQITRYALRDMELRGQNHNCRLWVSFDSNHQGSYAPMGIQYSLNQLAPNDIEAAFNKAIFIDCPEAKQSLLHHYGANSETVNGVSGFFDQYYNEVNNPSFGFPQTAGLRKIAMISGSDLGVPQTFGTACQLATQLEAQYKPRKILAVLLYSPIANILSPYQTQRTFLAPATGQCTVYKLSSDFGPDDSKKIFAPTWNSTSLDMTQGGFFPTFKIYKELIDGKRPKKWYKNFIKLNVNDYIGSQVQQLTYSTLAIGLGSMPDPTRKWDDNFRKDKYNQLTDVTCPETKESPFDMYWAPDINTRHDSLLLGHVIRLRREIIDKLPWQKTQLQRQATIQASKTQFCSGESGTFSVNQPLLGMTYNWSVSDPSFQVISGQGSTSVTIQHNGANSPFGYYTITCQASSSCYLISGNYIIHFGGYTSSDYPISGPSTTCPNASVYFSTNPLAGATSYNWFWPSGWTYYNGQGTPNLALVAGNSSSSGVVGLRVTNTCDPNGGTAAVKFVQVLNCGGGWGFRATPNPSLGNVTISTIQLATQSTESSNQTKIYQIKVIDQYGNVRKQYSYTAGITNTNINLSNLAGGIYIIQAFNGTTWVSQQVLKQ